MAQLDNADEEAEAALFKKTQEELSAQVASAARVQLELVKSEAARLKAQREALEAQLEIARAEAEARIFAEGKTARLKAEQEAVAAAAQIEMVEAQVRAEAKMLAETEAKVARLKEEQAAEESAQLELAKAEEEAARLRADAEALILAEAEAARLKDEQHAAATKAQSEIAEAEEKARTEADANARAKVESERIAVTNGNVNREAPATVGGAPDKTPRAKSGGNPTGFEFLSSLMSPNSPHKSLLGTLHDVLFNTPENSASQPKSSELSIQKKESSTRTDDLNKVLETLQSSSPGIEASALISTDGLIIASVMGQDMDGARIGAMTATLLSLGTRAGNELRRGELQEVVVSGDKGYAVMVSAGRDVLLLILATEATPLGLIFIDMREAVEAVRNIL
jgi:predicted regulator of Ras-like GTPase activity (Roadblock/LC7/MglB family)